MKFLRFAPVLFVLALGIARADDQDSDKQQQPPEEIPDFSNLDEYVYVPKTTVNLGMRFLSGPKTSFHGQGSVPSPEDPGDTTTANISRTYHDGTVEPDTRATSTDNGNGTSTTSSLPSDGKTNDWSYENAGQLTSDGFMQFHTYSGQVTDTTDHDKQGEGNMGIELSATHEMGTLSAKHKITWSITGGMTINDLHSSLYAAVMGTETTRTDTYDLYGQIPPAAPYSSLSSTSTNYVEDSTGAPITDSSGNPVTSTTDTTTLLGNAPLNSTSTTDTPNTVDITNRYRVSGAYYTFRAGPTVTIPFGKHLKLNVSIGGVVVYAGDEFVVEEIMTPEFGDPIDQLYTKDNSRLLPGWYADVTLQYNLTDTAGFYLGGVVQSAGSYTQSVPSGMNAAGQQENYNAKIDLSNQNGVRAGMTVKF